MQHQKGLTLVELVITIVIIGTAVAGVVGAFSLIGGRSANILWETRTTELGQLYLDEILAKRWANSTPSGGARPVVAACSTPGPEGESRSEYDDVDDFDTGGSTVSADFLTGSLGPEYNGYRVEIAVTCAGDELGAGFSNDAAKRIDVTIFPPTGTGQEITFTAYRANF